VFYVSVVVIFVNTIDAKALTINIYKKQFGSLIDSSIFAIQFFTKGGILIMLIIDSKDCENIDKALKKYKKKFEKSKTLLQLRERQTFTKPSVVRRGQVLKAIYKQQLASGKIEG
jgi:small subunit ribosomal protein S21